MGKYWKRRPILKNGEHISLKKLVKLGNSFAFVLPKGYVRYTCSPDKDGNMWVEVKYNSHESAFTIKGFQEVGNDKATAG